MTSSRNSSSHHMLILKALKLPALSGVARVWSSLATAASRTLVGKAYRSGFFWPIAVSDAEDLVRRCPGCQFFGKKTHVPAHNLITIPPSWSFACWSLDMIRPLTVTPGGFNHVLVVVDKFTKWIEYKPIVKISSDRVVDFISDIIHRFGFPHTVITDLSSNFTSQSF